MLGVRTAFASSSSALSISVAVLEWIIGFGFTFYLLTFFFDLRVSRGRQRGELSKVRFLSSPTLREMYGMKKVPTLQTRQEMS